MYFDHVLISPLPPPGSSSNSTATSISALSSRCPHEPPVYPTTPYYSGTTTTHVTTNAANATDANDATCLSRTNARATICRLSFQKHGDFGDTDYCAILNQYPLLF